MPPHSVQHVFVLCTYAIVVWASAWDAFLFECIREHHPRGCMVTEAAVFLLLCLCVALAPEYMWRTLAGFVCWGS